MTDLLEKFVEIHGPRKIPLAEFDELFKKAMMSLNDKYLQGTYDYVYRNDLELYQQLETFETKLNDLWGNNIEAFREILRKYYRLTLKGIEIYKKSL